MCTQFWDSSRRVVMSPVSGQPALSTPRVLSTCSESEKLVCTPLTVTWTTGIVFLISAVHSAGSQP